MRKVLASLGIGLLLLVSGCMAFLQGGGIFNGGGEDELVVVSRFIPHAEPSEFDPWPMFAGARWVYRNATIDFNPEVHPVSLLITEVLANVYCVDRATGTAWECFAVRTTKHPERGKTIYVHRSVDGLFQFSEVLQDHDREFPGFVALRYPLIRDTYWVYNVPRFSEATGDVALWERTRGCGGDRSLLKVGGEGDCAVASEVVLLRVIHDRETVGISSIVDSLLGGYTSVFTQAWKTEVYDGIEEYPDYQWWAREPEYAWLAPDIGPVKRVAGSSAFELTQFVHADEVLGLSLPASGDLERVLREGLVVVQLRGTEPTHPDSVRWVLTENSGLTPEAVADIDSNGNALLTGTYVFRFRAPDLGYTTLRFEREGPSTEDEVTAVSYCIKIGNFNSVPIAADDSFAVPEDTEQLLDVLQNDTDIDAGDRLRIAQLEEPPLHGTAEVTPNGVLYTPDPDYVGADSFRYLVRDLFGATASARVTVRVQDVNDPPSAADDLFEVDEDSPGTALQVLLNDEITPDTDETLRIQEVGPARHGETVISAVGTSVEYTPYENYVGSDNFTYTINDGRGGESVAAVTVEVLNVNDAPTAEDDAYNIPADGPEVSLPVLDNDVEIDPGDWVSVSGFPTRPEHGIVRTDGRHVYYTAQPGYHGEDGFTYRIADLSGETSIARVTLLVGET